MANQPLVTTGLVMPSDFPTAPYNAVHTRVEPHNQVHAPAWEQYAGAWNAVGYRFHACADHDEAFTASVRQAGATPQQPERHVQEREFFNFLVNGLATIESLCFGLFALGAMVDPPVFPIATSRDLRRITPELTAERYARAFPGEDLTATLGRLVASPDLADWEENRNVLAHRSVPGRLIPVSAALQISWRKGQFRASRLPDPVPEGSARWTTGIPIDTNTTATRRAWLAATTRNLLDAAATFTGNHL